MTGVSVDQWRGTIGSFNIFKKINPILRRGSEPFLIFSTLSYYFHFLSPNLIFILSIFHGLVVLFPFCFFIIIMLLAYSIIYPSLLFVSFPYTSPSVSDLSFILFLVFSLPKAMSYLVKNTLLLLKNSVFFLCVLNMLLLMAGIESNPGPDKSLSFAVWNLDSLPARDYARIPLIESFQATYKFDIFGICESGLTKDVAKEKISIDGFSPDPFRADKADGTRNGGVCLYFREDLPIKSRTDLATIPETIVAEIKIKRKKLFFLLAYRYPNIPIAEFRDYVSALENIYEKISLENPSATIICGDFKIYSLLGG